MGKAGQIKKPASGRVAWVRIVIGRSVAFLLFSIIIAWSFAAQAAAEDLHSTVSIGGLGGKPKFTLDVSARGRFGTIVVKDDAEIQVQVLTCDFYPWLDAGIDPDDNLGLRDYVGEHFVSGFEIRDLDFDGLPDIMAPREFSGARVSGGGASGAAAKYCVWLFNPNLGKFSQDRLSHQMQDLENLTVDVKDRQIVSSTTGSVMTRAEYTIGDRACSELAKLDDAFSCSGSNLRQLIPVRSCLLYTKPAEELATAITVSYVDGEEAVMRRTISAPCNDACGGGCPSVPREPARR